MIWVLFISKISLFGGSKKKHIFPEWWFSISIYHGTIRKTSQQTNKRYGKLSKMCLEPQTTIYKWMFGETTIFYIKNWNHPTETSIYKWLFRVPGIYNLLKLSVYLLTTPWPSGASSLSIPQRLNSRCQVIRPESLPWSSSRAEFLLFFFFSVDGSLELEVIREDLSPRLFHSKNWRYWRDRKFVFVFFLVGKRNRGFLL